jgi:hypothetical protein
MSIFAKITPKKELEVFLDLLFFGVFEKFYNKRVSS